MIIVLQLEIKADEYFKNNERDLNVVMTRNMDKYGKAPDKNRCVALC